MNYRVDRRALAEFVEQQTDLVETAPMSADLAEVAATDYGEMTADGLRAVWLAAGIATFIGQAIAEEPERFITAAPVLAGVA